MSSLAFEPSCGSLSLVEAYPKLHPDPAIETQREADRTSAIKRICIIGAGASGLAALKVIADTEQYKNGLWQPIALEARDALGGVW